ncbi:MAG: transcriptional repressor LexA [Candidatus Paceibacterota bacterium]
MENYKKTLLVFYSKHRRLPTYSEMMVLFGFKSKNAVYKVVNKMIDQGMVAKDHLGRLVPEPNFSEVKLLGRVTAGLPMSVEAEHNFDTLNLNDFLIEKKDQTFILEVDGDSMIEAHIDDGDMVIAERTDTARDGDIVIANIDGEFTMKYLKKKGTKIWLEPANKKYQSLYPEFDLKIVAVVKGVIRKY